MYITMWKKYFDYRGKTSVAEFWGTFLLNLIITPMVLTFIMIAVGLFLEFALNVSDFDDLLLIHGFSLMIFWIYPVIPMYVRRMRHTGYHMSNLFLISLIPIIGFFIVTMKPRKHISRYSLSVKDKICGKKFDHINIPAKIEYATFYGQRVVTFGNTTGTFIQYKLNNINCDTEFMIKFIKTFIDYTDEIDGFAKKQNKDEEYVSLWRVLDENDYVLDTNKIIIDNPLEIRISGVARFPCLKEEKRIEFTLHNSATFFALYVSGAQPANEMDAYVNKILESVLVE